MKLLDRGTVENSELVRQTFNFWLSDQGHIRCPFPGHIHGILREQATDKFYKWADNLHPEAKTEVNDEVVAEKFEELIFETAMDLVKTEDEKITLSYPFLPRLNDIIYEDMATKTGESKVVDRQIVKENDYIGLKLKMAKTDSGEKWETEIELPA